MIKLPLITSHSHLTPCLGTVGIGFHFRPTCTQELNLHVITIVFLTSNDF